MRKLLYLVVFLPLFSSAQLITTIAGNGIPGYSRDGGTATAAQLSRPAYLASDGSGNIYVADYANNVIRKINNAGIISSIAGTGAAGYSGDGGAATMAKLNGPNAVFVDNGNNIYIADALNNVVRKINTAGIITTIAGAGTAGYNGDGIAATIAQLNTPIGICLDGSGNLFIADYRNHRVRKIDPSGTITTVAGTGAMISSGDGGPATAAGVYYPISVNLDLSGNLYIAEISGVRKVSTSGIITTIAGTGTGGYNGDGIAATTAQLYNPFATIVDAAGNIYIADQTNNRIRMINSSGIISTIAGTSLSGYSGDGGAATLAKLNDPSGVCLDGSGNIWVADQLNNRVRIIYTCISISAQPLNDTVISGSTAKFWVTSSMPSATYQWQENSGSGFVDLTDVLPYSGVNTDTLTIHNVIPLFNASDYRCIVSNGTPCTDTSTAAILIVGNGLGMKEATPLSVTIFPNPAYNTLTIHIPSINGSAAIQLINEIGQSVLEKNITGNITNLDIQSLPDGMYIARIQVNGQTIYKKISKY